MDSSSFADYQQELIDAALSYAAQGLYVIPVRLGLRGDDKKKVEPRGPWKELSTVDSDIIRSWPAEHGTDFNSLAVDTGKSGIVVIDQDVTDGKDGPAAWAELAGDLTSLVVVRTRSGGRHDWYRADPELPVTVANSGEVADGVDVRGLGGFVFVAPTRELDTGRAWSWIDSRGYQPERLTVMPALVAERINATKAARKADRGDSRWDDFESASSGGTPSADELLAGGGNYKTRRQAEELLHRELDKFRATTEPGSARSHTLAQRLGPIAGYGVGVFWDRDEVEALILDACDANGFSDTHGASYAREQARSGIRHGMRNPWTEIAERDAATASGGEVSPEELDEAADDLIAKVLTPDQLGDMRPPRYLIKGIFAFDSEAWLYGAPGSKKSFVVLDMAMHVARGEAWQGMRVNQAPVLLIIGEGKGGIGSRVRAWKLANGPLPERFWILPEPVQASDEKAWGVLARASAKLFDGEPGMVILDTQARMSVGMEENSATDMGVYVAAVGKLRRATGSCVVSVHHTGKNGEIRGSSALPGAQDTALKVTKIDALTGELTTEKQKDLGEMEKIPLRFKVMPTGFDDDGDELSSLVLLERDKFLEESGPAPVIDEGTIDAIPEVQQWVRDMVGGAGLQARIVQALEAVAGSRGVTQSEARGYVTQRWYTSRGESLRKSTFDRAWNALFDKMDIDGEPFLPRGTRGPQSLCGPSAMGK